MLNRQRLPILLVAVISLFALLIWFCSGDFRVDQTWEEDALMYTIGENHVNFGFWKNKLIDDVATGNSPSAHPLLYTHNPNMLGVVQGLMQLVGIKDIKYIKLLFFILFFIPGMWYYFLVIEKLFTTRIALITLAVTSTSYLGVICWADNSAHSLHWVLIFGALFYYLSLPTRDKKAKNDYRFHLFMAYFFLFIVGMLNYIHVLFVLVTIGLFYVFKIHRVEFKYLILLFSAPFLLFILHQIRVVSLLGINVWMTDMVLNTKKALGQIGYRELLDYYAKHGIVVWAVDFQSISVERVIEFFLNGLRYREGIIGVFVLLVLIVTAIFHIFNKNWKRKFDIDKLGLKILTLFIASISWTLIFPVHAANYFGATPYIMLAGMINLGWALIFATIIRQSFFDKSKIHIFIIVLFFVIFSCQRVGAFLKHPIASIPGSEVLQRYEKAKFYSNIWPLFVSYYTHEWTVGGLHPEDAVRRKPLAARYFLQKDKLYNDEYFRPDYYLYVYWQKVAPFGEPKHKKILDQTFPLVESGDKWFIYKM